MRWAATVAGYSENTTISEIMAPLRHLIKDVVEQGFIEASIHAMWQVMDPVTGGTVDAHTKTRIDAAREILDRSVPKKTETKGVSGATTVVVIPAKTPTAEVVNKLIEHDPNEEISTP